MGDGSYHELFATVAEASATLTGLLFVALSVAGGRRSDSPDTLVQQIRASAALMSFTSALAISLFGLIPGDDVGYPSTVLGVTGLLFTAAALRSILAASTQRRLVIRQLPLVVVLLGVFGGELVAGVLLLAGRCRVGSLNTLSDVLVISLLVGVARSWELVGDRDISATASLATLLGRPNTRISTEDDDPV